MRFASLLLVACSAAAADPPLPPPAPVDAAPPPVDAGPAGLPPLAGEWIEKLDVPNGGWVTPPVGATEPRPIVVAVHGAIDDSGLICSAWRIIADAYPFVVCPSGSKVRKDTYVWSSSQAIDGSVDAALAAVRAKYGAHVAPGPAVYAAFSQGGNLAGPVLTRKTATPRFARAVLTEGGYRGLETATAAKAFGVAGGERVLFTCSQPGCATWFGASASALEHAGIPAHVLDAGNHGHSMRPEVRAKIHDALPWVVEGLAGWEGYAAHPKLASH